MNDILITVFLGLSIGMSALVLVLICKNLYDIFEEPDIQKRMRQLRKRTEPWVTVLLYARDNEATVESSLDALVKNKYGSFDIVVVNDRSKDETAKCVKRFIGRHPKAAIKLINRSKVGTAKDALEAGYRNSQRGEVVISLRSGTNVSAEFIKRAVATKDHRERVTMRLQTAASTTTLSGIARTLSNFLWLNGQTVVVSDAKHITPIKLEVKLDILTVFLFVIMMFVSILTQEAVIIWYSWILITSYLFAVIWLNTEGLMTKIKLSFSAVSALFLLPVSSFLQGISQFRTRI